jgi:hypothetical protein
LGTRLTRGDLVRGEGGEHKGVGESSTNASPRGVEPRCRRETALGDPDRERGGGREETRWASSGLVVYG